MTLHTKLLDKLVFVCNIQSREYSADPFNIQIDMINNSAETLLGIKTPRTLAFIQLVGAKAAQKCQFDEQTQLQLSCFRFMDQDTVLIGYRDGTILVRKLSQWTKGVLSLNRMNNETFLRRKVMKLHHNTPYIVALFADGAIGLYNVKLTEHAQPTLQFIESLFKLSFNDHKKIVPHKLSKQLVHDVYKYNFLHHDEFTNICFQNHDGNPSILIRFEMQSLNDIELLPFNPLEHVTNMGTQIHKLTQNQDALTVAFSGLDGYFRLLDMTQNKPLFSFKTEYGGIMSFSFNPTYQMVCLAGQDDCAYIVCLHQQITYLKLRGHSSFISRGVFSSITNQVFRVVCASYDGLMSFTELHRQDFGQPATSLFIKCGDNVKTMPITNLNMITQEGVCNIQEFNNYITTVNFDGSIRIFLLQ